jgi:hypothetical protein
VDCDRCGQRVHLGCSGWKRGDQQKWKRKEIKWKCWNCQEETGEVAGNTIEEEEADEELINEIKAGKECGKCHKRLRITKVIAKCNKCKNCFHHKCENISREQLLQDVRLGVWRCERCNSKEEMVFENEEGEEDDDNNVIDPEVLTATNNHPLRILQWNADGIKNKIFDLHRV